MCVSVSLASAFLFSFFPAVINPCVEFIFHTQGSWPFDHQGLFITTCVCVHADVCVCVCVSAARLCQEAIVFPAAAKLRLVLSIGSNESHWVDFQREFEMSHLSFTARSPIGSDHVKSELKRNINESFRGIKYVWSLFAALWGAAGNKGLHIYNF